MPAGRHDFNLATEEEWATAETREPVIRRLVSLPKISAFEIHSATQELGLSRARVCVGKGRSFITDPANVGNRKWNYH